MGECAGTCGSACGPVCGIEERPSRAAATEVTRAAEVLGSLLAETPEFQGLARWSRAVRLDPQVAALMEALRDQAYIYDPYAGQAQCEAAALEAAIEAQPVVRAFREAETQARGLFGGVDAAISQVCGLLFAQYAKPSGHG